MGQVTRREEFFIGSPENSPRRSERLAISTLMHAAEAPRVYEKWLDFGGIPVQTWLLRNERKGTLHFYRANGLANEIDEEGHTLKEASRNLHIKKKLTLSVLNSKILEIQ